MIREVVIGKKKFSVEIDILNVIDDIERIRNEEGFNKVYTEEVSTQEQIDSDCDNMLKITNSLSEGEDGIQAIVNAQGKKANGTFRKGGVNILYNAEYTSTLWEDSYCYATYALRAKAISDTELKITIEHERNTW